MGLEIVILIVGMILIVWGADFLVDGASVVARRAGLSEFVIGLTIVGMGTSAPEMVVSFAGALRGSADIAVGNVFGSNIFNVMLILGLTAVILPISITKENLRKDIPVNILVTVLAVVLGLEATLFGIGTDGLSRIDGGIMIALFIAYIGSSLIAGKTSAEPDVQEGTNSNIAIAALKIVGGLAALVFGGKILVDSAVEIARTLGVSEKFIAVTILAGGTSLPELATCIVAAVKKRGQLALGNILGSNIFNILLILGGSALIHPLAYTDITVVDLGALLTSSLLLALFAYTGSRNKLDRWEGVVMILLQVAYFTMLIIKP